MASIVHVTNVYLQDVVAFQITRDEVAKAIEHSIDVIGTPLGIKCNEYDLYDVLKDEDFVKHFAVGIMPCGEKYFPITFPPDGDASDMANTHEIYRSVNSDASVNGLSYFIKHSCPMGEHAMIFIWCSAMKEFQLHALTILNRIVSIQKKQSNMFLCFNFKGPTRSEVKRYLYPILGDIYSSDAIPDGMRCIFETTIPDRLRAK